MTGLFADLSIAAPDSLHGIEQAFAADPRLDKLDLGIGVYRDENGSSSG